MERRSSSGRANRGWAASCRSDSRPRVRRFSVRARPAPSPPLPPPSPKLPRSNYQTDPISPKPSKSPTCRSRISEDPIGSGDGDARPRHPPTPPDIRFSVSGGRTRRLYPPATRSDGIINPYRRNVAFDNPVCIRPFAAMRLGAPKQISTAVPERPAGVVPAGVPWCRASAARSISGCAVVSILPARKSGAAARPAGNSPTSREPAAATGPVTAGS